MREIKDLREFQLESLKTLIAFDEICRRHNLRYVLAYGTLIGAVRHKGFIPWDDDLDVLMPRPDMDKFIEIVEKMNSDRYGLMNTYDSSNFYAGLMMKFYRKDTLLIELADKYDLQYGLFVDIFPVDGVPFDENLGRQRFKKYLSFRKHLHFHKAMGYKKNAWRRKFRWLTMPFAKRNMEKMKAFLAACPFDTSDKVIVYPYMYDYDKAVFDKSYFDELVEVEFEKHKFWTFKEWDKWLKLNYGDYMTPPPESERVSIHSYKAYIKDDEKL